MIDSRALSLVVLLVEDNAADAELMSIRLGTVGTPAGSPSVHLVQSPSATAACVLLRHHAVDVVILDLALPDARGLEALHLVRDAAPNVPVIVLTGREDQELALAALRAGAQDYLLKPPPDGVTMARILRYACERHRLLQQLDVALRDSARAARRWRLLAEVGKAFAASRSSGEAIAELIRSVVPEIADCFVLFLCGERASGPVVEVGHVDVLRTAELADQARAILGNAETCRSLVALCETDSLSGVRLAAALDPMFAALKIAAGTALPVRVGGCSRGFLLLGFTTQRPDSDDDGEFARFLADRVGVAFEQDRLLRQMQRAVEARDRAVSVVSHDLRNPLSAIQICANALLDPDPAPPSGVRHMAELIQRSAEWMQHIVRDLLDRTNIDTGNVRLRRRRVAVADILSAIDGVFGPIAAEHAIELVLEADADLPALDADPDRLLQALANLMSNAMKFTPRGGRVVLLATIERVAFDAAEASMRREIRFSVRDTGPGIAPGDIEHVFDWFWRAPGGGSDGAGLGLGIAKGLIEAHDGRLHVESASGQGTTFWFTLSESTEADTFAEVPA